MFCRMCNHYRTIPEKIADWAVWAGYKPDLAQSALWPKRDAVVARIDDGAVLSDVMIWGVPLATTGASGKPVTKWITNVRNLASPFWKSMLSNPEQRCLVPFTSFAEPKPGRDAETGRPAEWWFRLADDSLGAFAGIWRASDQGKVFAFLTCEPNPLVAPLHPKAMPVILDPGDYRVWLEGDYGAACALATPYPSQLMRVI